MIKIAVDGRLLQGNLTGVGKYVLQLIEYIAANIEEAEVSVYTNRSLKILFVSQRITVVNDKKIFGKIKPMIWSKFLSFQLINAGKPDIYLSGDTFVPFFLKVKRIISVVHDVSHIVVPETMSSLHLLMSKVFFKADLLKADAIITNSAATAEKVKRYFNRNTDVIFYPIIANSFIKVDAELVKAELEKLKITFPYILSVATQEPRKNLDKTINAFIYLKKQGELKNYKLVLTGGKGWKNDKTELLISSNSNDIISLGYVSDSLLPILYNGAGLFVFPSKYEGFGMPPREAMLCGAKVLVTGIAELKEATYHSANYIDDLDWQSLGRQMVQSIAESKIYSKEELENFETSHQRYKIIPLIRQLAAS